MTAKLLHRTWFVAAVLSSSCAGGPPPPATLDTRNETCASCRMTVSDRHFASQIVAPGEEPLFFDDLGCLATYLADGHGISHRAAIYVADHASGNWSPVGQALFTRCPGIETPMGSHLVAHVDAASRDADPAARGGTDVAPAELFAKHALPGVAP